MTVVLELAFLHSNAASQGSDCDEECRSSLAAARAATAKYHDVNNAWADGFIDPLVCVQSPSGAMGNHFVNPARTQDINVDVTEPEVLLYLPDSATGRRLIGVEYIAPVIVNGVGPWFGGPGDPPPPGQFNPAPVLFGRAFAGPMPGHEPGMPWHYDLHVWLWLHNPDGMFALFNPAINCP
ncbi:MAG TPA: hypothetical protein DEA22_01775 [Blastocatellia bacterium]|nr:hypothetical protein [Blastocatellia bacterium]